MVKKLFYMPFKITSGFLAGFLGKRLFAALWGVIDGDTPPLPEAKRVSMRRLALSLGLQGAVFSVVRGLVDHGSRRSFYALTGAWPGNEKKAVEVED